MNTLVEPKTDLCSHCSETIVYKLHEILYDDPNICITPCCMIPIHVKCVMKIIIKGCCVFCNTLICDGEMEKEFEELHIMLKRRDLKESIGLKLPNLIIPSKTTSFQKAATEYKKGPKFIQPSFVPISILFFPEPYMLGGKSWNYYN